MENELNKLIEFWDKSLASCEPEIINERWIHEDSFLNPINKYIKNDFKILDYGCGSGWLSYELALLKPSLKIIGIDPSPNAISFNTKCASLSGFNSIEFVCGKEDILNKYPNTFDLAISVNTLDVLPIDVTRSILRNTQKSIKRNGYFIVCINPDFPIDLLLKLGYSIKDGYLYKDDILRGLKLTKIEWVSLLNEYFTVIEFNEFILTEGEKAYPRRMFILKNNK